ncbi:MAG: hypothetical protein MUE62_06360 [Burkholderiaceae bacterium]|jgi:hypothetical protein|nr:hypothetical protein [Burkholderiaceae bacterium]
MSKTTLRYLIEQLQDMADTYGENTEVRIAHQPSWPFEYGIGEVVAGSEGDDDDGDDDPREGGAQRDDDDTPVVVYIGEGTQLGYLPGNASRALGWR